VHVSSLFRRSELLSCHGVNLKNRCIHGVRGGAGLRRDIYQASLL
jgi:hypothetical protein